MDIVKEEQWAEYRILLYETWILYMNYEIRSLPMVESGAH
jgi:hypothetical protein